MSVKKDQNVLVFQDKMVFAETFILSLMFSAASVLGLYFTTLPTSSSPTAVWLARIFCITWNFVIPIIVIINPQRYLVWYRFSREGITYHTAFRRKKLIPYSAFPYVMHGRYFHFVYWRDYIVFSNRRLTSSELNQINHVAPSDTLLKVKCSEKICNTLMAVLPVKYQGTVAAILRND